MRDDYGFGDIWAGWNLPPDSALIWCSLSEIDGKGSRWFLERTVLSRGEIRSVLAILS